jgi:hypothetical protein
MNITKLFSAGRPVSLGLAAIAFVGVLFSATPAKASDGTLDLIEHNKSSNGEFHILGFVNQDQHLQDQINTPVFGGGFSYTIDNDPLASRASITFDYIEKNYKGNQERLVPVQLEYQVYNKPTQTTLSYFDIGGGLAFTHLLDISRTVDEKQMLACAFVGYGLDTTTGIYIEGRYQYITEVQGERMSGPELLVGIRF